MGKKDSLTDYNLIRALANLYKIEEEELYSHSINSNDANQELIENCAISQTESKEGFNSEKRKGSVSSGEKTSRKKILKMILIPIFSIFLLLLALTVFVSARLAFSDNVGYGIVFAFDAGFRMIYLFIFSLIVLIGILIALLTILFKKNISKKNQKTVREIKK